MDWFASSHGEHVGPHVNYESLMLADEKQDVLDTVWDQALQHEVMRKGAASIGRAKGP
jgi:hypothetical protein